MLRVFLCVALSATAFSNVNANSRTQKGTQDALNFMHSVYDAVYAPTEWKKSFANWDLDREYQTAITKTEQKGDDMSVLDGRRILMDFIYSMRDYHVSIRFVSTSTSTLPFTVRSADGKYFIVNIDREKLGEDIFPFAEGDEVVTFGGRPVDDVVQEIRHNVTENVPETDQALAELNLTSRKMGRGLIPEQGPVTIGVRKSGSDNVQSRQLIWDYKVEDVPVAKSALRSVDEEDFKKPMMPRFEMSAEKDLTSENPHGIGAKNSFLPTLGETIWESAEDDYFQAYIYRGENNKMIGVVRIKSYSYSSDSDDDYIKAVTAFSTIVNRMEKFTDALVIDQLNNPGGSVFYLYALASTLSPEPLRTPRHIMSITPQNVLECVNTQNQLRDVKTDEEARKALGETIHGYPVNLQVAQFFKSYCATMQEDWSAGHTLSRHYWIGGVDHLNPYPKGTYSKPILVLVNELDFSGGDFFPTIMQDNGRAKIFGTRTAGAGGYVLEYQFPNFLGVDRFRVTQSLAQRVNENPIENLGVTPDIPYQMKASDRQNNYKDYVTAVKDAVQGMLQ